VNKIVVPICVTVDPKPGEPDPAIRLRQWLKLGLRAFGIRATWAPATGRNSPTVLAEKSLTAMTHSEPNQEGKPNE
jgi:hypothetical protein